MYKTRKASVLHRHGLLAIAHNGPACHQADEGVFIVNDRNEILLTGTVDQILHAGGNAHRHIVPPVGDFHNPMVFRLPQHLHIKESLKTPELKPRLHLKDSSLIIMEHWAYIVSIIGW